MALHSHFPRSPYAILPPDLRWFPAAEELRRTEYRKLLPPLLLTNIHRVYLGEVRQPSLEDDDLRDYFLSPFGPKPVGKNTDSKVDLCQIVREIDELAVFNDEAHHIHDPRLEWFKSIQDIHHRMVQKELRLALQLDVTATPRHNNGAIFVQTVSDYPLVEAIAQNVVKHPVLPDAASRARLREHQSPLITEKYADYLQDELDRLREESNRIDTLASPHKAIVGDDLPGVNPILREMLGYPTQKPECLLERFISASSNGCISAGSNEGDLVAEKLGRNWIAVDLGKFAIHTTRKRLPAFEERWTGGYIFENEWQSFRTRQNRDLELMTPPHRYDKPGRYTVAVKVIDIFGNDTMTLVPISVG